MVDFSYYSETYKGQLSSAQFAILEPKAADEITIIVGRALTETELALTEVKKATCYLVDYFAEADRGITSENLGAYSYTIDNSKSSRLYSKAISFLKMAQLYSRSVCVC